MHAVAAHASVRPAARAARPRLSSRGAFGRAVRSPAHFARSATHTSVRSATHAVHPRLSSRGAFGPTVRDRVPARFARSASARVLETRAVFAAVVEPATKVTFPDTYSTHDNTAVMKCLGAGVRQKKIAIINVKVYAVAMYADAEQCASALEGGDGLLDGKFHKALLVQLVRNVDGKTFWEALDEALVPRIREIATNMATAEDAQGNFMATVAEAAEVAEEAAMAGMDELKDLFSGANLKKDSRILINWKPGKESATTVTGFEGKLEVGVVGADATVELTSMELARALFDVYLGDAPVSPDAKAAFEAGAATL